jgi:hypothetical protein
VTGETQKPSASNARRDTIPASRKADVSEAERKLKMAERSALLMQVAAIEEYLGITRRCKECGADL